MRITERTRRRSRWFLLLLLLTVGFSIVFLVSMSGRSTAIPRSASSLPSFSCRSVERVPGHEPELLAAVRSKRTDVDRASSGSGAPFDRDADIGTDDRLEESAEEAATEARVGLVTPSGDSTPAVQSAPPHSVRSSKATHPRTAAKTGTVPARIPTRIGDGEQAPFRDLLKSVARFGKDVEARIEDLLPATDVLPDVPDEVVGAVAPFVMPPHVYVPLEMVRATVHAIGDAPQALAGLGLEEVVPESPVPDYVPGFDAVTNGLTGQYYDNIDLTSLVLTRVDATVDFNWGSGSPHASIGVDTFSVRWSGQVQPLYSETYTFYILPDDGTRMWVNGQLLVDTWLAPTANVESSGTIALVAGQRYDIVVEFFENGGGARAHLSWSSASQAKQIIPTMQLFPTTEPPNTPPTVSITAPANGQTISTGTNFTIAVDSNDVDGGVLKVEYLAGTRKLGESLSPAPYTYAWNAIPTGIYELTARSMDRSGALTVSAPIMLIVGGDGTNGLLGEYYDNMDLTAPIMTRVDPTVDFNWGNGGTQGVHSPHVNMGTDSFSVRWSGQVLPEFGETYTFTTRTDDGSRLWVNGQLLVNEWHDQGATDRSGTIALVAGTRYDIVMEYFENGGDASAQLSWSSPSQAQQIIPATRLFPATAVPNTPPTVTLQTPTDGQTIAEGSNQALQATASDVEGNVIKVEFYRGGTKLGESLTAPYTYAWNAIPAGIYTITAKAIDQAGAATVSAPATLNVGVPSANGLLGEYYDNNNLTHLVLSRVDSIVFFDWGNGTPHPSIGADTFSVRWRGQVLPEFSETYTFYTLTDDGLRLWVDGQLLIDSWVNQSPTERSGAIALTGGQRHDIVMEYYEQSSGASAKLYWSSPSTPKAVIPQARLFPTCLPANVLPVVSISTPADGTAIGTYGSMNIQATASDADGSVVKVEFYAGNVKLADDLSAPFEYAWSNIPTGSYTLTAKAIDRSGGSTVSAPVTLLVGITPPNLPPTVAITSPVDYGTFNEPGTTLQVTTADTDGTVVKVEYFADAIKIGESTVAPFSVVWNTATQGDYTLTARAWDDGGQSTVSSAINVTVNLGVIVGTGSIFRQYWTGIGGTSVSDLVGNVNYPDYPTGSNYPTIFEGPVNWADNYGTRMRGYVHPPVTGDYYFWIASDDSSELWLSSDEGPNNRVRIAYVNGYSNSREWTKFASQRSAAVHLLAGQRYYIEALQKEGGGGDNLAAGWQTPCGRLERPIPGVRLSPFDPTANMLPTVSITSPVNGAVFDEPANVTITVNAADPDGVVLVVQFYSGTSLIGESTTAPYTFVWPATAGTHVLKAKVVDDKGGEGNSPTVTITVNPLVVPGSGTILREWWLGIGGGSVSNLTNNVNYPNNPSGSNLPTSFEGPTNWADNYGTRMRGYVHPPVTGNYVFVIASDDSSQLFLSPNDQPGNKSLVAYVNGYTNSREWTKFESQRSVSVHLVAGQKYYIEALQKEGGGGDNLAVAWIPPSLAMDGPIPGYRLTPYVPGNAAPTVVLAAAATPNLTMTGTSNLQVLGADDGGEANLTYTWAVTAKPGGAPDPAFSANGTNASKNCTATFTQFGDYTLTVTITDADAIPLSVQSSVNVTYAAMGLTATLVNPGQVDLTWSNPPAAETGFRLERKTGAGGVWATLQDLGAGVTSAQDNTVALDTTYYYRVFEVDAVGDLASSNEVSVTTPSTAPTNLTATLAAYNRVALSWDDPSSGELGFRIERRTGLGGTWAILVNVGPNVTTYQDGAVAPETTYYYRAYTLNLGGLSPASNEDDVTMPPAAPTGLTAVLATPSRVDLTWVDHSSAETGFRLERMIGVGGVWALLANLGPDVTSYQDATVVPDTRYFYRVFAVNVSGDSAPSNTAAATTIPLPPTGLMATAVAYNRIDLNWTDASAGETSFRIERKTGVAGTWATLASVGANVSTYQDNTPAAVTTYVYRVYAVSPGGSSAASNEAQATTFPMPPIIVVQPAPVLLNLYESAIFSVTVMGTPPLAFQWRRNGVNIPGANSVSYTAPPATVADNGAVFSVVVTNVAGTAVSNGATLSVNTSGTGLTLTTYPNTSFSGIGTSQVVPNVNLSGATASTSMRWTGFLVPVTSGTYTFYARTTGGVRLWLNGALVINAWNVQTDTTSVASCVLQSGQRYTFKMEFVNRVNSGSAILEWGLPGWGPVPGGPAGSHVVIPQNQFFSGQTPGTAGASDSLNKSTTTE